MGERCTRVEWACSGKHALTRLLREDLAHVLEGFELKGVAAWVEQEHGGLLANLAFESDVGFNYELGSEVSQAFCQGFPLIPLQDNAEVRSRHVMAIDRVAQRILEWGEILSSQPFIRYDRSSFGGRQVDRFLRQMHFTPREVCELDELDAITELVGKGLGVALVPQTVMRKRWPSSVRALDLGDSTFHRDIGLVHHANVILSEQVTLLANLIEGMTNSTAGPE